MRSCIRTRIETVLLPLQVPRRVKVIALRAWRDGVRRLQARRRAFESAIRATMRHRIVDHTKFLLQFWRRYAAMRLADRTGVEAPFFHPRLPEWDAYVFGRRMEYATSARVAALRKRMYLEHPFKALRAYTQRAFAMRHAWAKAAAHSRMLLA